ncbi:MAG: tetratricopeptide repeat protein [Planctomycetota bacterium]|jgi:tetratricopeptide (TPR) repeat protein
MRDPPMPNRALVLLLFLAVAAAPARAGRREAEVILREAIRLQTNPPRGVSQDDALNRAYIRMADAFRADPTFWMVLLQRGLNRCTKADLNRSMLRDRLQLMRTQGAGPKRVEMLAAQGGDYIDRVVMESYQDFQHMHRVMKRTNTPDKNAIAFANAMMKFAQGEFLKGKRDAPGAIDDLKSLIKRDWQVEHCADLLARIYMRMGAEAFQAEVYDKAHEYWDAGLRWAVTDRMKRDLLTNKAGAHATRNEYELAEGVLRGLLRWDRQQPEHWKNLGLTLGYQSKLPSALYAYRHARTLARAQSRNTQIVYLHGNAWLKAAMIHGKLLEADGDLKVAWRLFLEYREMFGDDYNFCFNFGEFCFHMGQYELAWTYLRRAADIHPFCPNPFLLLVRVSQRLTEGTPEEREARREKVKTELEEARRLYKPSEESHTVRRICGGLQERGEERMVGGPTGLIEPDPLDGLRADGSPPAWLVAQAEARDAHQLFDPSIDEFLAEPGDEPEPPAVAEPVGEEAASRLGWFLGGGIAAVLLAFVLLRRKSIA